MLGLSVLCLSAARSGMCEAACRALSGPLPSPDPQKAFLGSSPSGLPRDLNRRRQPARVEEGTKGGASTVAVARRRHERDLGWRERRKQPLQHQHPSARSSAWPPRRVHSSHCTPFLSNSTAINGMWLVTLLLLYSLREGTLGPLSELVPPSRVFRPGSREERPSVRSVTAPLLLLMFHRTSSR
ncbi:unnamed protein product [Arctogadus glacialis]